MFHPDDPLFAKFRHRVETEQGTLARTQKTAKRQSQLPLWLQDQIAERDREEGITPLESNALALRYELLKPGPDFALIRPENKQPQMELLEPPSRLERQLRARIGELIAGQSVEDEGEMQAARGRAGGSPSLYHRYNAVLKRVMGNRSRAEMTLAELEASVSWLGRNRLADHVHHLDGDSRYAWTARQRACWSPPVGRRPGTSDGSARPRRR